MKIKVFYRKGNGFIVVKRQIDYFLTVVLRHIDKGLIAGLKNWLRFFFF